MAEGQGGAGKIRMGSRASDLALWQTGHVRDLLQTAWPDLKVTIETMTTTGDRTLAEALPLIGGKGLFTAELEAALRAGTIDAAVHSLKDLPTDSPDGLVLGAVTRRANPADVLISRDGHTLETLPKGAAVGTSSSRRAAQLLQRRPDLRLTNIRGNVPTRIQKALDPEGPYDAIILAYAGLERLERLGVVSEVLPFEQMVPAPGQAALAVQCRHEAESIELLAPLDHAETRATVEAERAFLAGLGGGCAVPVAALAEIREGVLHLFGRVTAPDGAREIDVELKADPGEAVQAGQDLAEKARQLGAAALLDRALAT